MAPDSGGAAGSGEPKIAEEEETPMCDADEEQLGSKQEQTATSGQVLKRSHSTRHSLNLAPMVLQMLATKISPPRY